jgi:hypothetical protein
MGVFKSIFGKKRKSEPTWNIKPAAERPAAWSEPKPLPDQPPLPAATKKERHPFLDDEMLDTMQLEADTLHEDNPYQTHTWEMDPEEDTRKLRTVQIGKADKKDSKSSGNPYDTGSHRRGWRD